MHVGNCRGDSRIAPQTHTPTIKQPTDVVSVGCLRWYLFVLYFVTQTVFFNPLLDDIFYQQRDAPFLAVGSTNKNLLGFFVCPEGNIFCFLHKIHLHIVLYTLYIYSLDNATNTL